MWRTVTDVILFCSLILCSITDIRTRTIPVLIPAAASAAAAAASAAAGSLRIYDVLIAVITAVFFAGIARLSREAFGYGDCFLIWAVMICCGPAAGACVILTGFFICAAAAAFMLAVKRVSRTYKLPFVPFLCISHAVFLIGGAISG